MKKFLAAFWRMLRSNLLLKIMAILFAVILWSYVLSETNPQRQRTLDNIPVIYENMDALTAKDLAISGSLSDILDTISVTVKVNQSDLRYLNEEDIKATVDLSTINGTGEHTLKITVSTSRGQVVSKNPSEVTIYADEYVTRTVPVNVELSGSVPDGYYISTPELTPNVVDISGAKVDVEKVTSATCLIDVGGLTHWDNKSVDVTLLDNDGLAVDSSLFSDLPSVIVSMSILPEKTVPVDAAGAILSQDSLAPGYEITGITCTPENVTIVGEAAAIQDIESVSLVPYSVSGASVDAVVMMDYALPAGVSVLDSDKAEVYVSIREITDTKKYTGITIEQKNLASGLTADMDQDTADVTVLAGVSKISALDRADIVPYIDLDGLEPGTYTLNVQFEIPEGFVTENFSSAPATVTVEIRRK